MTDFEDVYARFRGKVMNYDIVELGEEVAFNYERELLMESISDFSDVCSKDLHDYDSDLEMFNVTLSEKEISILSLGMVQHFLEPYVYNTDALQNSISTKDFQFYSPANLLEKMTELLNETQKDLRRAINMYSFRNGNISGLNK